MVTEQTKIIKLFSFRNFAELPTSRLFRWVRGTYYISITINDVTCGTLSKKLKNTQIHLPIFAVVTRTFRKVRRKSNFAQVGPDFKCLYTRFSWNPCSNTQEPHRQQHGRPADCVIAQQYSSQFAFIIARKTSGFSTFLLIPLKS
jgi:hypothetical protein